MFKYNLICENCNLIEIQVKCPKRLVKKLRCKFCKQAINYFNYCRVDGDFVWWVI